MYTDKRVNETLVTWAEETSAIVDSYLDITFPFLSEKPRIEPKHQFILKHLAISCNYTSHSTVLLIANGSLWEAEMLIRSVLEGSLKYAFLCASKDSNELNNRFEEYWDQLFEISQIKDHQKTAQLLSLINDNTDPQWKPLRDKLLSIEELERLQEKYYKKVRQPLEQKWSFNGIIQALVKQNPEEFNILSGLASNYNLSSHFLHQDSYAVQLVRDRNQREEKRKTSLELAHGGTECMNLIMMAQLRAIFTFKLHNEDIEPIRKLYEKEKSLHEKISEAYKTWMEIEYGSNS